MYKRQEYPLYRYAGDLRLLHLDGGDRPLVYGAEGGYGGTPAHVAADPGPVSYTHLAPVSTHKVSRIERDTKKLRMLWGDGYQQAVDRMDEIRAFLTPDRA